MSFSINLIIVIILFAAFWGVIGYLIYLLIKALRKYIRSEPVRREKSESAKIARRGSQKAPRRVQDDAGVIILEKDKAFCFVLFQYTIYNIHNLRHLRRLSLRFARYVPRLWKSCTSSIRTITATIITRYL